MSMKICEECGRQKISMVMKAENENKRKEGRIMKMAKM